MNIKKILIDKNIIQYSIPFEPVYQPIISSRHFKEEPLKSYEGLKEKYGLRKWDEIVGPILKEDTPLPLRELIQKIRVKKSKNEWERSQKRALFEIAYIALEKFKGLKLQFYNSSLNKYEGFDSSSKNDSKISSYFSEIPFGGIPIPVDPFKLQTFRVDFGSPEGKSMAGATIKVLSDLGSLKHPDKFADMLYENKRINLFERNNLFNIQRFKDMCRHSNNKYIDCFYLWTAEVNEMEYFLTTDKGFIRSIKNHLSKTRPILPSELIEELGFDLKSIPYPFIEGEIRNSFDEVYW